MSGTRLEITASGVRSSISMPKCREARGLSIHESIIPPSNKSEIVVVFDTEDTKKAKEFAASADLKEAMEKAGVLDTPTIYFLESID